MQLVHVFKFGLVSVSCNLCIAGLRLEEGGAALGANPGPQHTKIEESKASREIPINLLLSCTIQLAR